jgi:hypothetical protein
MGKSSAASNSILALIYNAVAWANMADNAATGPLANIYIGLHTGAIAAGDNQTVNEATYGAYARLAIPRTTSGFEVPSLGSTHNKALAQFLECTSGSNTITHVSTGVAASGASAVLHAGALSSPRTVSAGIQPQFAASALVVTES